jgi:O-acetyl-ADP-ribose deacetylase (regulator of RNase III)
MITFTQGNLLEAEVEALVNTVNTVGVMGKGIALMFKERFPENFRLYAAACKAKEVQTGRMFVTEVGELQGPRWIINFPTKQSWRSPSQMGWIEEGLQDLRRFLLENRVNSVAVPPLGAGNGGLPWTEVRERISSALADLDTQVIVFEPTPQYLNVAKRTGVEKLTPARAMVAELIRRYWVQGMECSLLEVQKLAWLLERAIEQHGLPSLDLRFKAHKYGPYAERLRHLLESLDGSYLHCDKRIADAGPWDVIWFEEEKKAYLDAYLASEAPEYLPAIEATTTLIDGFESPFGLELLATVDWQLAKEGVPSNVAALTASLHHWSGGTESAARKVRLFEDKAIDIALRRLAAAPNTLSTPNALQ